ncbi:MAG: hypothetical protein CSB55_07720 [Candidatus Cloacimonadota bacterium]|nr:MAG: hypothetical protein CSB55_07720 [Candidatus Cloacimonadota bacterium]
MKVLSVEEMKKYDQKTMTEFGIPSRILMETAGNGCADFIKSKISRDSDVLVICGSGNNGGDGFVIARRLFNYGFKVKIFLFGNPEKSSPETKINYELARKLNIPVQSLDLSEKDFTELNINKNTVIVEALFGIGFKGNLSPELSDFVTFINEKSGKVFAVDIAGGIEGNTGKTENSFRADYTLAIAKPKYGHLLGKGFINSGKLEIVKIGIPKSYFEEADARLITEKNVKFPERRREFNKGNYGKPGIIAGSRGLTGAAIMASRAALRSGAGLITLFHPENLADIFETSLTEVMTKPLKNAKGILNYLKSCSVILLGPGLGQSDFAVKTVKCVLENYSGKLVIDADGLNILSENPEFMTSSSAEIILTPHLGEFARLSGNTIEEITADPIGKLKEYCRKRRVSVLLKNFTSVFCRNNKLSFITSGNDGLATGGSGDVLSGIITSFLAQNLDPENAVPAAAFLLGKTAEKASRKREPRSIVPTDIINSLFVF